ncbi:NAD(P)-binding domain-containing protein [Segnochrobactrum spirostomi]|uniref:Pyrroline-5-carboxylate reductase n=1 Tax=Segnochrobactrum spirostomi TaxID=2608987 RepID=A0A6A7Y7P5_9HYPH|nr:NAD(P)-binding domain-containing protein [Segnochrobactrum spirostomi]MQT15390.1 hypothetical protein [Segnochrobactrum spirostomi]
MRIGILGVGHLGTAIVEGLLRSGLDPASLVLSPRGRSAALAERHDLSVARDNHALVQTSDLVVLAVRPASAPESVAGLPWRTGQVVMSVCAGIARAQLSVEPAAIVRAMPLTAAEIRASPTVFFPRLPAAQAVLERLGPAIALASEADFEVATVVAAVYGWAQDLIRRTADWTTGQGMPAAEMRRLVALTFVAAGRMMAEKPVPMPDLMAELVTPGGITELGLRILAEGGQPALWDAACAAVLTRLTDVGQKDAAPA